MAHVPFRFHARRRLARCGCDAGDCDFDVADGPVEERREGREETAASVEREKQSQKTEALAHLFQVKCETQSAASCRRQ